MLTLKQINAKIVSIRKRQSTLKSDIQTVLVNMAGHVIEHGDYTAIPKLLDAASGQDLKAIMKWLTTYAAVKFASDGTLSLNKSERKAIAEHHATGADYVMFLNGEPEWFAKAITIEEAAKALDVAGRINSLAKSVLAAAKEGREIKLDADSLRGAMRTLQAALEEAQRTRLALVA